MDTLSRTNSSLLGGYEVDTATSHVVLQGTGSGGAVPLISRRSPCSVRRSRPSQGLSSQTYGAQRASLVSILTPASAGPRSQPITSTSRLWSGSEQIHSCCRYAGKASHNRLPMIRARLSGVALRPTSWSSTIRRDWSASPILGLPTRNTSWSVGYENWANDFSRA